MTPNEHIKATDETSIYQQAVESFVDNADATSIIELLCLQYEAQGLADEAGEVLGKVKKILRDHQGNYGNPVVQAAIKKEMGDVLFYFSRLCKRFGWTYEELMGEGMLKLLGRKERGTLHGSGDDR